MHSPNIRIPNLPSAKLSSTSKINLINNNEPNSLAFKILSLINSLNVNNDTLTNIISLLEELTKIQKGESSSPPPCLTS